MAKITFQYRSTKETGNLSIRLTHSKEIDFRVSTPIQSKKEYWFKRTTNKTGKTVWRHKNLKELPSNGSAEIKEHKGVLETLEKEIEDKFIIDLNKGEPINGDWLKEVISKNTEILNTKEKILEVISTKENKAKKKRLKKDRIHDSNLLTSAIEKMFAKYATNPNELKKYKVTLNLLLKFQENKKQVFSVVDINQDFANSFMNWALLDMKYSKSYINTQLKKFRSSAVNTYENDEENIIKISKTLRSFKMFKDVYKGKIVITLNYDELDKIDKTTIEDTKLQDAKKAILIGCETGLRYSDMNKLVDKNIKEVDKVKYWKFRTEKTDTIVQITITKRILYLIDKFGLPKNNYPTNGVKLNEDIKKVCVLSKIDEKVKGSKSKVLKINGKKEIRNIVEKHPKHQLITSRTFRRSFATNYFGKIDTSLIIVITGHKTEHQLRAYISNNEETNIKRTKEQIDQFHEERQKEIIQKAKLKVV